VSLLSQSAASLSHWKHQIHSGLVHAGFVAEKVVLGQISLRALQSFSTGIILLMILLIRAFIRLLPTLYCLNHWQRQQVTFSTREAVHV